MLVGPQAARRSTAKNAYDFLTDLKAYSLEEPRRLYMSDWLVKGRAVTTLLREFREDYKHDMAVGNLREAQEARAALKALPTSGPVCNTVGCIAGNIITLAHRRTSDFEGGAIQALGLPVEYDWDNQPVSEVVADLKELFYDTGIPAVYGTRKYVRLVNKAITKFQQANRDILKASALPKRRAA
jgi:hypothetical protein